MDFLSACTRFEDEVRLKHDGWEISGDLSRVLNHRPHCFGYDILFSACYRVENERNCEEFGETKK